MRETLLLIVKTSNHAIPGDSKQFAFLGRSCKNFKKSSNFLGREGESRRLDIGPKQMALPSKVRILVLFKKRFSLKKTINRKLQR